MHAYTSIARQEGVVGGLWRGTGANITRNAIVNVGETVVYDAAKDALLTSGYMRCSAIRNGDKNIKSFEGMESPVI